MPISPSAEEDDLHVRDAVGELTGRKADVASVIGLIGFLLVYFYPFIVANSGLVRIGNDFHALFANYATYFVDSVRGGFIPLWNPNEGAGFPFATNPFTAFLYPGRILWFIEAFRSPVYSWYHHQIYTVAGVALLACGLFAWLRERGFDAPPALFAAAAVAIGYRIADLYRLPNAIHSAAWMPWILLAYDRWLKGSVATGFLLGIFAWFCLATAGYPYYAVYFCILIGSYVALRIAEGISARVALIRIASLFAPVVMLVLPYYVAMSRMLAQTVDRAGDSYAYSAEHGWTYVDLLGGLVFPMSAVSEGWLYCGMLPVLLVATWAAVARPSRPHVVWMVGLGLGVQLIAAGSGSFLFPAIWSLVPGVSGLRVWARLTIILVPAIALAIASAYHDLSLRLVGSTRRCAWTIAAVVAALQLILWLTRTYSSYLVYWPFMQGQTFVMATLVAALYIAVWSSWARRGTVMWAFLALVVTASDTGIYGRQIWRESLGARAPTASLDLAGYYTRFFSIPRTDGVGMQVPYAPTYGVMANWYYDRYVLFVRRYRTQPSFAEFLGAGSAKVFFSQTLDASPEDFERWWMARQQFERQAQAVFAVTQRYDGNQLHLSYHVNAPAHLIFVDNWDGDWHAIVNGADVPIERSFGTFKAVHLQAGSGTIRFEYRPRLPYPWVLALGLLLVVAIPALGEPAVRRYGAVAT